MKAKILRVWTESVIDQSPDMSYLGEYSNNQETEWDIDRQENGDMNRGDYCYWNPGPNHIPPGDPKNWKHVTNESIGMSLAANGLRRDLKRAQAIKALDLHYIQQDYARCESYNRGDWCYLGIIAKAEVQSGVEVAGKVLEKADGKRVALLGPIQTLRSGGLWGIESDSADSYFAVVEQEELAQLADELKAFGFGDRAIKYAIKRFERVDG
jgi:hypothetical protein